MEADIAKFKSDYYRCWKYDLKAQIPHLAKLADNYHQKYRETKHWTDCLKVKKVKKFISPVYMFQNGFFDMIRQFSE